MGLHLFLFDVLDTYSSIHPASLSICTYNSEQFTTKPLSEATSSADASTPVSSSTTVGGLSSSDAGDKGSQKKIAGQGEAEEGEMPLSSMAVHPSSTTAGEEEKHATGANPTQEGASPTTFTDEMLKKKESAEVILPPLPALTTQEEQEEEEMKGK